jgi:hypothetical protein
MTYVQNIAFSTQANAASMRVSAISGAWRGADAGSGRAALRAVRVQRKQITEQATAVCLLIERDHRLAFSVGQCLAFSQAMAFDPTNISLAAPGLTFRTMRNVIADVCWRVSVS